MFRTSFRISRHALITFCLATSSFWGIILLLNILDRTLVKSTSKLAVSPNNGAAAAAQEGIRDVSRIRLWRPFYTDPSMAFSTSPYNAANQRKLRAPRSQTEETKVISWQAARTLRVLSTTSEMFENCPVKSCEVSPSAKSLARAHAIVFDDGKMNKQTPPQLNDKRVLVYYDMRTTTEVYFKAKGELFSQYWKSAINWVWSYRLNSDIFEPFAYVRKNPKPGKLASIADAVKKKSKVAVWINPKVNRKDDSLEDLDKNFHKSRSQTDLEDYVKDFKKMTSFESINIIDLQTAMNDPQTGSTYTMDKYFFILAFEWVNCTDYVTDLFFYAFDPRVRAVPVVRGGLDYAKHFPKGTFINADDFASPKELANHLEKLASNTKAYTEMLWKKSQYVREPGVSHAWCQLCAMLHRLPYDQQLLQRYEDIHQWAQESGQCKASNVTDVEEL